jgi:oligoribonuclease
MKYISLDLETTGVDHKKHQIIEIGAILEDTTKQLPYSEIPKFHCIVKPEGDIIGTPFALNMNKRILEILAEPQKYANEYIICSLDDAIGNLYSWYKENTEIVEYKSPLTVLFAGKNFGTFDKLFLEKSNYFNELFRIKRRVLDPSILYTDFIKDEDPPNTEECMKRAGLELINHHYALDDAWNIIQLLRLKY